MSSSCALILLYFAFVGVALGCDGLQGKVYHIRSCNKCRNHLLMDLNSTMELTKNCEVVINTCVIAKGFKTAIVKPTLYVNDIKIFSTEADLCALFIGSNYFKLTNMAKKFGLPTKCSVETAIICDRKPIIIDIKPMRKFVGLLVRTIRHKNMIITNNGTTCYEVEGSISRI